MKRSVTKQTVKRLDGSDLKFFVCVEGAKGRERCVLDKEYSGVQEAGWVKSTKNSLPYFKYFRMRPI